MGLTVIPAKKQLRKKRYSVKLLNGTLAVLKNDSNRSYTIAGDCYSLAAGGQLGCPNESLNDYTMDWWSVQHDSQLARELGYHFATPGDCKIPVPTNGPDRKRDAKRKRRNDSGFSELSENFSDDGHVPKVEFNKRSSHAYERCGASIDPSTRAKDERGEPSPSSSPSEDDGLHGSYGDVVNTPSGLHFDEGRRSACSTQDVIRENLRDESGNGKPGTELLAEVNTKMPRVSASPNDGFCMGVSKETRTEKQRVVYEKLCEIFQLIKTSLKQWRTYV